MVAERVLYKGTVGRSERKENLAVRRAWWVRVR
jgi:hypothetical protein